MSEGEHPIELAEVAAAAASIEAAVQHLLASRTAGGEAAQQLLSGDWQTPGASTTFELRWAEWDATVSKLLGIGPELAQWLRNYARDAGSLEGLGDA